MELVIQGHCNYIMLKRSVIHDHSQNIEHFIGKLKRNIGLFYSENKYRKYTYDISKGKMIYLGLVMGSFIVPFASAVKGFMQIRDLAWFIHPWICSRSDYLYESNLEKYFSKTGEMIMVILICGGAGYIGSHVNKAFSQSGHRVIVFDNLIHGHREAVKWGLL